MHFQNVEIEGKPYLKVKTPENETIFIKKKTNRSIDPEESPTDSNLRNRQSIGSFILRAGNETNPQTPTKFYNDDRSNSWTLSPKGNGFLIELGPTFRLPQLKRANIGWLKSFYVPYGYCPSDLAHTDTPDSQPIKQTTNCNRENTFVNFFKNNWTLFADYDVLYLGKSKSKILALGGFFTNRTGDIMSSKPNEVYTYYQKGVSATYRHLIDEEGFARSIDFSVAVGTNRTIKFTVGIDGPFMKRKQNPKVIHEK